MARKGGQLHVEVNSDDDWEKLLLRDGLILVDVYSDWCGPCTGMSANLKKIKLEIAGDILTLALGKCDNITALERFRYKSEPTWMYISKGKMTNLIYGANAPEIIRVTIDEVNKERQAIESNVDRPERIDITELHPAEIERFEEKQRIMTMAKEKEEAKRIREVRDRKTRECQNILGKLSLGCVIIFPCARDRYADALADVLKESGTVLVATEKVHMDVDMLEELFFFYDEEEPPFDQLTLNSLLSEQCAVLCIKGTPAADTSDWEILLAKTFYGRSMAPPGDTFSFYQKMMGEVEDEETGEVQSLPGLWFPKVPCIRATMIRMFFPKYSQALIIPDPGPVPPHFTLIFETDKIKPALSVMSKWPKQFLHYGFFTKEDPEDTELVAKSVQRLEMPAYRSKRTYEEKLVMAVSKKKSELLLNLVELGPMYMSTTTEDGAKDAEMFFPDDYADSLPDDEKVYIEEVEEDEPEGEEGEESSID